MRQLTHSKNSRQWIILFSAAFLLGVFAVNIWYQMIVEKTGLLDEYTLLCMEQIQLDHRAYFWYLLKKRGGAAALAALLSSTYLGLCVLYISVGWLGLASGIVLSTCILRYGAKGILLFIGSLFPHQIILIPCSILLLCWCYAMCTSLYFPNLSEEPFQGKKGQFFFRKLLQFSVMMGVVIIGCLLECYVNPYIMSSVLKLF